LGDIFWEDFLEDFFGRNYLLEINKEFVFCQDFGVILSQWKEEGREKEGRRILDP
jgi:hypothetical protein